jgi:hypothetical protein
MRNGIEVVKNNPLISKGFIAASLPHRNPLVSQKVSEKSIPAGDIPHEAESRLFSFMGSHRL